MKKKIKRKTSNALSFLYKQYSIDIRNKYNKYIQYERTSSNKNQSINHIKFDPWLDVSYVIFTKHNLQLQQCSNNKYI